MQCQNPGLSHAVSKSNISAQVFFQLSWLPETMKGPLVLHPIAWCSVFCVNPAYQFLGCGGQNSNISWMEMCFLPTGSLQTLVRLGSRLKG